MPLRYTGFRAYRAVLGSRSPVAAESRERWAGGFGGWWGGDVVSRAGRMALD
jgi:hypothetical protein